MNRTRIIMNTKIHFHITFQKNSIIFKTKTTIELSMQRPFQNMLRFSKWWGSKSYLILKKLEKQLLFGDASSKQMHTKLSNDGCLKTLAQQCLEWPQTWTAIDDVLGETVVKMLLQLEIQAWNVLKMDVDWRSNQTRTLLLWVFWSKIENEGNGDFEKNGFLLEWEAARASNEQKIILICVV